MLSPELVKSKALEFLKNQHLAVLATSSQQNEPHASYMGYLVDENFNFYFISINNSRKLKDLQVNPNAGIAIASTKKPTLIQGGGRVEIIPDVSQELFENLFKKQPNQDISAWPIAKLATEGYSTVILHPTWLVWLNLDEQEDNDLYQTDYHKII